MLVSRKHQNLNSFFLILSIILFLFSLAMPGFNFYKEDEFFRLSGGNDLHPGLLLLIFGWYGLFGASAAWLANPLGLIAIIAFRRKNYGKSFSFSAVAFFLALSSIFLEEILIDEGGGVISIYSMGIGFYFWISSIFSIIVGSIYIRINNDNVQAS
jgi:hypothetical protein